MLKFTIEYDLKGRFLELTANASILPGMLLKMDSEGKVGPSTSVLRYISPLIAVEDKLAGQSIAAVYETNATVHCRHCLPGDIFMGLANDHTIEKGMFLTSAGNGKLKEIPTGLLLNAVVGQAIAAPSTEEAYSYFAINGISLEEVYSQAAEFCYVLNKEIITLDDFIPVEVI